MSKHEELIARLRASAAAMLFDTVVVVHAYRANQSLLLTCKGKPS